MVWTRVQRDRLAIEKEKLEQYFRLGVTWIDPQGETKVQVLLKSNADREYKLRIYIPPDFPNSCPALVVVSPPKLLLKNGKWLPEMSYPFHTLEDTDGFHRICHFYPPDWTPDITLYQVFMKGRLWIEAYEAHLETGEDMDVYLGEQKFTVDSADSGESPYESGNYFDDPLDDYVDDRVFGGFSRRERLSHRVPDPYMPRSLPHSADHNPPSFLPFSTAGYQSPERCFSNETMLYSNEQNNNTTSTINNNNTNITTTNYNTNKTHCNTNNTNTTTNSNNNNNTTSFNTNITTTNNTITKGNTNYNTNIATTTNTATNNNNANTGTATNYNTNTNYNTTTTTNNTITNYDTTTTTNNNTNKTHCNTNITNTTTNSNNNNNTTSFNTNITTTNNNTITNGNTNYNTNNTNIATTTNTATNNNNANTGTATNYNTNTNYNTTTTTNNTITNYDTTTTNNNTNFNYNANNNANSTTNLNINYNTTNRNCNTTNITTNNNYDNNSSNYWENDSNAPTLSFPPCNSGGREEQGNQEEALLTSVENLHVNQQPSDNQNNNEPLEISPPSNRAPPQRYRPAGAVNVMLTFHEEMIRRNSSSRSRPTVVPPPVKPKPRRQPR